MLGSSVKITAWPGVRLANQAAVGVFFLIELPLLGLGQKAAIGFYVGMFLLFDRFVVRQQLLRFGRRQLAALESFRDAIALIANPAIDLFTTGMLLGEATSGRTDGIARATTGGSSSRGRRGCVFVLADQPAIGIFFLIELPLLGLGQKAAIGFYVSMFLLFDRFVIRQQLFRFGRRQLAALESFCDAIALIANPAIDLFTTGMLFGEPASRRADGIAWATASGGSSRGRRGGVLLIANQAAIGIFFVIELRCSDLVKKPPLAFTSACSCCLIALSFDNSCLACAGVSLPLFNPSRIRASCSRSR